MSNITLRGLALSKYKTIGSFAEAIGWQRQKASRVLNDIQKPDVADIQELVKCLEINTQEMFLNIFFTSLSTMWTTAM